MEKKGGVWTLTTVNKRDVVLSSVFLGSSILSRRPPFLFTALEPNWAMVAGRIDGYRRNGLFLRGPMNICGTRRQQTDSDMGSGMSLTFISFVAFAFDPPPTWQMSFAWLERPCGTTMRMPRVQDFACPKCTQKGRGRGPNWLGDTANLLKRTHSSHLNFVVLTEEE